MKSFRFTVLLLSICSGYAFAQNSKLDSLKNEIQFLKLKTQLDSLKRSSGQTPNFITPNNNVQDITQPSTVATSDQIQFKNDFLALQSELNDTKYNLEMAHKKYTGGFITSMLGWGGVFLGTLAGNGGNVGFSAGLILGGFITSIVGHFIMIDSHKYIGRAGAYNSYKFIPKTNTSNQYNAQPQVPRNQSRPTAPTNPNLK